MYIYAYIDIFSHIVVQIYYVYVWRYESVRRYTNAEQPLVGASSLSAPQNQGRAQECSLHQGGSSEQHVNKVSFRYVFLYK